MRKFNISRIFKKPLKTPPEKVKNVYMGEIMSNFNHRINHWIAMKLRSGEGWAAYPAFNFHGTVWFENGKYYCAILRFHIHVDTISAKTPRGIMRKACRRWGAA